MAHNKNRIVSISNALSSYNDKADQEQANNDDYKTKPMVRYKEGRSSTAIYAMKSLGIDPLPEKSYSSVRMVLIRTFGIERECGVR